MSQNTPNNTNASCPSDISQLDTTDWRPSKALYENIIDNNSFRLHLQRNANKIRAMQLAQYEGKMGCCSCEGQPKSMVQFNKSHSCKSTNALKR